MNREGKKKNIYENSTIDRACMSQPQIPASLTLHKLHPLERLFLLSYPPLSRMHKSSLQWILLETCSPQIFEVPPHDIIQQSIRKPIILPSQSSDFTCRGLHFQCCLSRVQGPQAFCGYSTSTLHLPVQIPALPCAF